MSTPPQTRICPNCAAPASSWAQFCRDCGTLLPAPGQLTLNGAPDAPVEQTVPWRAWEGILLWVGAVIPAALLPLAVLTITGWNCAGGDLTGSEASGCDGVFVGTLVVNEMALLLFTVGWVRARYNGGLETLGIRRLSGRAVRVGLATAALGMLIAYGVNVLVSLLYRFITQEELLSPKQVDLNQDPGLGLLVLLGFVVMVIAPVAEEVFFRGFVYRGLRRWATPAIATAISAVVFGVAHFIPLVVLSTALLGIVLARVVERERDIMAAIVAHMVFNAVGFTLLLASGEV